MVFCCAEASENAVPNFSFRETSSPIAGVSHCFHTSTPLVTAGNPFRPSYSHFHRRLGADMRRIRARPVAVRSADEDGPRARAPLPRDPGAIPHGPPAIFAPAPVRSRPVSARSAG
eukprot:scaffold576_cov260-Pinguiococcus_pyrenoidosus.AAC.34